VKAVPVKLTADLIESFAGTFLSPRYDNRAPTPQLHREAWALYCSDNPQVMCIAPREHAKSTALTMVYTMAEVLFRCSDYVILVSSTEDLAAEQLGNISEELHENQDIRREFGIKGFESDTKADIIVTCNDGHRFRILCRGAEQRIRGRMWNGKRPNLLVCDDMEDDEQVENPDRRTKFRRWFFRAAKQALGRYGKTRVHGTVLHDDSLLNRLKKNKSWKHLFYAAHESFDDFSNILWPEQWPEARLRARREEFIQDGDAAGYSQEFLNNPLDNSEAFLRKADFRPMVDEDYDSEKIICASADFAVSKADKANRTCFTVGGKDVSNILHFLDVRKGRWDPVEWIDEMFSIQQRWSPEVFWVEDGVIWKSVRSMIYREMQVRDITINFEAINPVKDKATRGRSYQKRMRAGLCRFDKHAEWYPDFEQENLRFTGIAQATLDDQFDSPALLSKGFDDFAHVEKEDFYDDEERDLEAGFWQRKTMNNSDGRSVHSGY
jgi:predicted phage terminase large subunit-like protein